jgi:hypothetical protein
MAVFRIGAETVAVACDACLDQRSRDMLALLRKRPVVATETAGRLG